jgi:hypothetical protein
VWKCIVTHMMIRKSFRRDITVVRRTTDAVACAGKVAAGWLYPCFVWKLIQCLIFSSAEIVNPFARFPHTQDGAKINRLAPVWLSWMPDDFLVNWKSYL